MLGGTQALDAGNAVCAHHIRDFNTIPVVYGHTHLKATVPVPLTESKQVLARSVLGRVTTREYRVL